MWLLTHHSKLFVKLSFTNLIRAVQGCDTLMQSILTTLFTLRVPSTLIPPKRSRIRLLSPTAGSVFAFYINEKELNLQSSVWTTDAFTNLAIVTHHDVLIQLLHILLDTIYNTPPVFLLARY